MEKKVYVCSPLSAPTAQGIKENMVKAGVYARKVGEMLHCRAIAPHAVLPMIIDDNIPEEREIALKFGIDILNISDAIVVCGKVISSGMKAEIEYAREKGIPVIFYDEVADGLVSTLQLEDGTEIIKRLA